MSSNKRPRRLFSFKTLGCSTYKRVALKRGRRLFQSKKNYSYEFKNFVSFSFQKTINNYCHDI